MVGTFAQLGIGAAPAGAATVANYVMSPTPIATTGSLKEGQSVTVTLEAEDSSGNGVTGAPVFLSFTSTASNPGSACVNTSTGCSPNLTSTPTSYTTGNGGLLSITYTTFGSCLTSGACQPGFPSSGTDTITAQNAATSPSVSDTDSYTYGSTLSFSFNPTPIAPPTSLNQAGANPQRTVTLTVTQNGSAAKSTQVWLLFSQAKTSSGGSDAAKATALCGLPGGNTLSGIPTPCTTDSSGQIAITYTADNSSSHPTTGADIITAQDKASSPASSATDEYDYAATGFAFSPTPVAPSGALGSSQSQLVTLTVTDSGGNPQANTNVWLSLTGPSGGSPIGSASATGAQNPVSSAVGTSPTQYTTDTNGKVAITYATPAKPPSSGTDTLTAQDASSNPSSSKTDTYTYAPPAFTFSPNPIAPTGSLSGNQAVPVSLTVESNGQPQAGGTVYLSFAQASGGGSASVGSTKLTSTPQAFTADAAGTVSISYATPATPPASGADTITAANAASSPTKTAADTYTFGKSQSQIPQGYWLVGRDGGIFSFGVAKFHGSTGNIKLAAPIVGMASTPDAGGYWFVGADGGVFSFGDARYWGSTGNIKLAQPVVGMATTPDGGGYWLVAKDGGIFSFGDARFFGSTGNIKLAAPIVGMAATPDGAGYWFVGSDGGVFSFGDAKFQGSTGAIKLAKPVVGMASTPTGGGYWLVASDGGIFTFGDARFFGSTGNITLAQPVVGMSPTPDGAGYWFVASDGGIFTFGDAQFFGSMGGKPLAAPIVGMAGI